MTLVVTVLLSGCALLQKPIAGTSLGGPAKPPIAEVTKILNYQYRKGNSNYFRTAYDQAATNPPIQIDVRNTIILEMRTLINQNYADYESALRDDRNIKDLASNLAALALTAGATVAGGQASKTILSAIATGVLGANAEIDRTLFRSLTIEALTHQMQALRAKQDALILKNMTNSIKGYPLDMALDDLNKLYQAGFVTRGLQGLAETSANVATTNQESAAAVRNRFAEFFNGTNSPSLKK